MGHDPQLDLRQDAVLPHGGRRRTDVPRAATRDSAADLKGVDAVIIGAPYVASWTEYAGVPKSECFLIMPASQLDCRGLLS